MTHHLQKSAITKLVFGLAIKLDTSNPITLPVAYNNQLGNSHGLFLFNAGRTARKRIMNHKTKMPISSHCQARPISRYSHPWLPHMRQCWPMRPFGPIRIPINVPAISKAISPNNAFIHFAWLRNSAGEINGAMNKEAPIQQADIQSKDNCTCQLLVIVTGKSS